MQLKCTAHAARGGGQADAPGCHPPTWTDEVDLTAKDEVDLTAKDEVLVCFRIGPAKTRSLAMELTFFLSGVNPLF